MTGRFYIVSPVGIHDMRDYNVPNDDFEWRMYNVSEFDDKGVTIPTSFGRKIPHPWNYFDSDKNNNHGDGDYNSHSHNRSRQGESANNIIHGPPLSTEDVNVVVHRTQSFMKGFSKSTHLPTMALNKMFPIRVVHDIIQELKSNPVYSGLHADLPAPIADLCKDVEDFSFWLASNLPLSQSEKMDILETFSLVERLQLLLRFMRKRTAYIRCTQCRANIALVDRIFKVGSAEGASGAYVNEYGVVHQTTTLLDVVENGIVCEGSPEARDSWFPGYAWTIAYCSTCYSHLGWKFTVVKSPGRTTTSTLPNNPSVFWGLSGSQIQ